MPTLYVVEQNTILRKQGNRLLLCKRPPYGRKNRGVQEGDILLDLPCADVDHVMIFGNIQVTTQALHQMLQQGAECALFSYSGKLLGQLTPPLGRNIQLRARQCELFRQPGFRLQLSRLLVDGKITNALNLLLRYSRNHPEVLGSEELQNLPRLQQSVRTAENLDSLRGYEGAAAAAYFRAFRKLIRNDWQFSGRNKRPPQDPVNAVLSFGYVVAGSRIQSLLDGMGFDPFLGIFHENAYGRPSLALDLLEEFRQPLVDRLAMRLFNRDMLKEEDFVQHSSGGVYLNGEGKRKFFHEYEQLLGSLAGSSNPDSIPGILEAMRRQIHLLTRLVMYGEDYVPYCFSR